MMTMSERVKFTAEQREKYQKGTRVFLVHMADDPNPIPDGTKGTVEYVDDSGQVHIRWDCGRSLAASEEYGDVIEIIDEIYIVNCRFDWDGSRGGFNLLNKEEVRKLKIAEEYCIAKKIIIHVPVNDMDYADISVEGVLSYQRITGEQAECLRQFLPFTEYIEAVEEAILQAYKDSTK